MDCQDLRDIHRRSNSDPVLALGQSDLDDETLENIPQVPNGSPKDGGPHDRRNPCKNAWAPVPDPSSNGPFLPPGRRGIFIVMLGSIAVATALNLATNRFQRQQRPASSSPSEGAVVTNSLRSTKSAGLGAVGDGSVDADANYGLVWQASDGDTSRVVPSSSMGYINPIDNIASVPQLARGQQGEPIASGGGGHFSDYRSHGNPQDQQQQMLRYADSLTTAASGASIRGEVDATRVAGIPSFDSMVTGSQDATLPFGSPIVAQPKEPWNAGQQQWEEGPRDGWIGPDAFLGEDSGLAASPLAFNLQPPSFIGEGNGMIDSGGMPPRLPLGQDQTLVGDQPSSEVVPFESAEETRSGFPEDAKQELDPPESFKELAPITELSPKNGTAEEEEEQMATMELTERDEGDTNTDGSPTDADMEARQQAIPLLELSNFKDSWDPYDTSDNPVFWHIPKAGGSTVKDIIGTCHRFVMATEFGVTDGHESDTEIAVVYPATGIADQDRSPFVNVDTTTIAGIQRAAQMGFADSGLADAIVTPFIYEANSLFTSSAKGRLFSVFRHPIDRAISMFYYIQVAHWEPSYRPELQSWTLEQYATSDIVENNWMVRQLSQVLEGDLTEDHLNVAIEVVRRKFLVGLMTEMDATMDRFEKFFRWKYHVNPPNQEKCRDSLLHGGGSNSNAANKKAKPAEGSREWELLSWQNQYDLRLYHYIEAVFKEQEQFVMDIPDEFRNLDATCCKCNPATFPEEGFTCPLAIKR